MTSKPSDTEWREAVSDTGPLISLEKISGGFSLLRSLFDRVLVPPQVVEELRGDGRFGDDYLLHHGLSGFIHIVEAPLPSSSLASLDTGERYAISLALERRLPLLIEDRRGRRLARMHGLVTNGAAGLVGVAALGGLVTAVEARRLLDELVAADRISAALRDQLIDRVALR